MKTDVPFFESYAHVDLPLADDFVHRLHGQLAPSRCYRYQPWRDTGILVGQTWLDQIARALDACRLGLLLLSPAFLASPFIDGHELPRFVGAAAKPVVPVVLQPVHFQRHDLKGLENHQLFRLDGRKAYGECHGARTRDRFVEQLFEQIEQRLDQITGRTL